MNRFKIVLSLSLAFSALSGFAADFNLIGGSSEPLRIYVAEDEAPVVGTAVDMFKSDLFQVSDLRPNTAKSARDGAIIVGTIGMNSDAEKFALENGVSTDGIMGEWEAYKIVCVTPGSSKKPVLFILGSDSRGTAYGVLELSRMIGVSPWEWWADVTPDKLKKFKIGEGFMKTGKPSVQFRGIFLNDEDWGLTPWAYGTFEPGPKGQIGPNTYSKIFELLLRLRANTIWPAMHEVTTAFYQVPGNDEATRKYGIVVGTSHCEPLLYNSAREWDEKTMGRYNFLTNRENVVKAWTERLKQVAGTGNHFYTMGMRGKHDGKMEGVGTTAEYKAALEKVIPLQRELLSEHTNPDVTKVPQAFIPYKEVLEVYDSGLEVPDDITLVWCDDNYGYITRLSNDEERGRSGGSGIYYHMSYWGRPHDYLWLSSTHPAQIYSEMSKAWNYGARRLWIANAGDIKPCEYDIEFFMDMAWGINSVDNDNIYNHLERWASREFGADNAKTIADVMWEYYRLGNERKPEFMGWSQVELDKARYNRGLSPATDTEYNPFAFGDQIAARVDAFSAIQAKVERIKKKVPKERLDAFFQLVEYPVNGAAYMSKKVLYAQKARLLAQHGIKAANTYSDLSTASYGAIGQLTDQYNKGILAGKWDGIMDMRPRKLPVFDPASLPGKIDSYDRNVLVWPENSPEPYQGETITAPVFIKENNRSFFISLFSKDGNPVSYEVNDAPSWLKVESRDMGVYGEYRIVLSLDGKKITQGQTLSATCVLAIRGQEARTIEVKAVSYGGSAAGYEADGMIALNAADYSKAKGARIIQGSGHSGKAVALEPANGGYNSAAPVLEYDIMTSSEGEAEISTYVIPIHPVNGGDTRVAVSVDGEEPVEVSFKTAFRSEKWKLNVLRNQAIMRIKHDFKDAGMHTIRIYTPDDDMIIDQLTVDFKPDRKFYAVPVK